jgi:hypothetical protein
MIFHGGGSATQGNEHGPVLALILVMKYAMSDVLGKVLN